MHSPWSRRPDLRHRLLELSERREYQAFREHLKRLAAKRTRSRLVAEVVTDAIDDEDAFQSICQAIASPQSGGSPTEERLKTVGQVVRMIEDRAPARESRAFKAFVYDVGLAVARAHRERLLPLASPISHREDFWLRRLGKTLRM